MPWAGIMQNILKARSGRNIFYNAGDLPQPLEAIEELGGSSVCLRCVSERDKIETQNVYCTSDMFSGGFGAGCSLPECMPRVSLTALFMSSRNQRKSQIACPVFCTHICSAPISLS